MSAERAQLRTAKLSPVLVGSSDRLRQVSRTTCFEVTDRWKCRKGDFRCSHKPLRRTHNDKRSSGSAGWPRAAAAHPLDPDERIRMQRRTVARTRLWNTAFGGAVFQSGAFLATPCDPESGLRWEKLSYAVRAVRNSSSRTRTSMSIRMFR